MGEGRDGDDFEDAKVGAYAGVILWGVFGVVFLVGLVVAIGVTIAGTGTARIVGLILILPLAVCAGLFGFLARWSLRLLRKWKRLDTEPIRAWATLGESRRTSTKIQTRNLYVFSLTVTPANGPPYDAETKWFFPLDLRSVVAAGTTVAVRIDPDDPSKVVIDWPQSRAAWAASSTDVSSPDLS